MTFSDYDLKRLKERATKHDFSTNRLMSREHLEALLSRLEAAEVVVSEAERWEGAMRHWDKTVKNTVLKDLIESWRKAAGK